MIIKRLILTAVLSVFWVNFCYTAPPDVGYAGFAFVGESKDIPVNFRYTSSFLNSTKDENGRSVFDKEFFKFFRDNRAAVTNFNLLVTEKADTKNTKLSMAVALSRENVSVVNIEDVYKIVVNLCCNVIFLNFENMQVVASYPLYLEYVHVMKQPPKDEDIVGLLKQLYFAEDFSIMKLIRERLASFKLKNDAHLNLKIMNVEVEDEAKDKLEVYKNNLGAFKSISAQKFSDFLSSKLNVAVLPYAKDYLGAKMALAFADTGVLQFSIPSSSYGIDFILRKLTKEIYKEGIGEDAYLFGAYITIKVYDPELGTNYLEKKVKYGAVKNIPKLQKTTDDFSIYDEMIGLVMLEALKEMQSDKPFYKEVIERCQNN